MAWELIFFIAAMAGVMIGCLLPAGWLPLLPNDKLLHFSAFAVLTLLATCIATNWIELCYWLLGLLVTGWLIEVLQNFIPGRQFSWRDLAANAAGILAATACAPFILGR